MFSLIDANLGRPAAFNISPFPFTAFPSGVLNSLLPEDVLRQVLECAARSDRRTALTLTHLSRTVQSWIDEILYAQVHLLYPRTVRLFLRTIHERPLAKTKPTGFFEHVVRSLFVCSDVEPESVLAILSVCRGVNDLSYWAIPQHQPHNLPTRKGVTDPNTSPSPFFTVHPSPKDGKLAEVPTPPTIITLNSFDLHNLSHVCPQRLSVLLHEYQPIFIFRPTFGIPFFAAVTHLSLVNRWEEWTSWAGSRIQTETMPSLVCLKFDLAVRQAHADGSEGRGSRSKWLDTVTNISPTATDGAAFEDVDMDEEFRLSPCEESPAHSSHSAWTTKMEKVASAISEVLNNHAYLKVCVLILRFDTNPAGTAKIISRLASPKFKTNLNPNSNSNSRPGLGLFVDNPVSGIQTKLGFDPRLVFAWEKEPFRYNYAHSAHEGMIWKSAEAVAKAQRYLSGYTVLNCDCLI